MFSFRVQLRTHHRAIGFERFQNETVLFRPLALTMYKFGEGNSPDDFL
jgi:hypothetical protein